MVDLKANITKEAAELFLKRGCKAITMDDIAKTLGISKRTIYENFKDKEDLLTKCCDLLFAEVDREMANVIKSGNVVQSFLEFRDSASSIIHRVPKGFFEEIKRYFPKVYNTFIEPRVCNHKEQTVRFLKKGIEEGYFIKTVNVELVALIIQETGRLFGDEDIFCLREYSQEDLFLNGFIFYLRGLSTQKGIDTIDKYYKLK